MCFCIRQKKITKQYSSLWFGLTCSWFLCLLFFDLSLWRDLIWVERQHGEASSRFDSVSKAAWHCNWTSVRKMRRKVCNLRLLCPWVHVGPNLRRMQLWVLPRPVCHLWWCWNQWRLLLQRMHHLRKGPRRLPEDCKFREFENGLILRTEEIRLQKEIVALRALRECARAFVSSG